MSILGYSAAYFLPKYWVNTPLYGEKIIPLLDYVLSTDYAHTDKLASAFYNIESKYKNTSDLPIDRIEAIIEESGYKYIRDLLGNDEESLKLLVYLLVLVHELKGSKKGIETVLSLLKGNEDDMELSFVGNPYVNAAKEVSDFTVSDYVVYSNFSVKKSNFEMTFQIKTGKNFNEEQCIASSAEHGFYLGINTEGKIVLKLGQDVEGVRAWQEIDGKVEFVSDKTLNTNTNYYISFIYSGYDYVVKVSANGGNYLYYVAVESNTPLGITGGYLYLGIDKSTPTAKYPFQGSISLAPVSVSSSNVSITQWFETFPVGEEDTFMVDAEVDVGLISSEFFVKFAKFAEKYVYPSLKVFRARLSLKSKVTFLPYVRQRVTYVASNVADTLENFMVVDENDTDTHIPYEVEDGDGAHENYFVQRPNS